MEILYEDETLIVLNKPAGWITTRENYQLPITNYQFLEDWVGENRPNDLPRKGVVHRLDKGTSGIVVVAKTNESLQNLKSQFKQRKVIKHYYALAGGDLPRTGSIKMPIDRSSYSFGKFKVDEDGKMAETEFEVVEKYTIDNKKYSLIDINLKTGRTHQIRVHLSYLGWPLVGDKTYGGQLIDNLNRPFLHAYFLQINQMVFKSPLANDLQKVIDGYEKK